MLVEEIIPFKSKAQLKKEEHDKKVKQLKQELDDFESWKKHSESKRKDYMKKRRKEFDVIMRRSQIHRVK